MRENEQVHGSDQLPLPRILQRASLGRALQVLSAPLPEKLWLESGNWSGWKKPFAQGWTHTHTHGQVGTHRWSGCVSSFFKTSTHGNLAWWLPTACLFRSFSVRGIVRCLTSGELLIHTGAIDGMWRLCKEPVPTTRIKTIF